MLWKGFSRTLIGLISYETVYNHEVLLNISSNLASGNKAGKLTVTVVLTNITLEYLISLQESLSH